MVEKFKITEQAVVAHFFCLRKAYQILFNHDKGEEKRYSAYLEERKRCSEQDFFLIRKNILPFSSDKFSGKAEIIKNAIIKIGNLEVQQVHLQKRNIKSRLGNYHYEPIIFSSSDTIKPQDRIKASYAGSVLSEIQSYNPHKATVVLIDGKIKSIRLGKETHISILNELQEWLSLRPEVPPVALNKHCPLCHFEESCISAAEKDDSIILLGNMTPKVQKKFNSKGIFTIKQLSYLYKPRRRSRARTDRKPTHRYELQALALRTQKIYTTSLIKPPKADVEIFIDIESIPEQSFHYLVGVLVCKSGTQTFYSFWANGQTDEKNIWESFLEIVNHHSNVPIFHYGSYERKVIRELGARYNTPVNNICDRLCNLNTYIFGRIYFPTRTNRLKDICEYLGFNWTIVDANGLDSIVLRYEYDQTQNSKVRNRLTTYNKEDCINLKKLKDVIQDISQNSFRQDVRAANDHNQPLNTHSERVVKDFNTILKSAHGKYEQSKISLKKIKNRSYVNVKNKNDRGNKYILPMSKIDKLVRVPRARICHLHKRALVATNLKAETIIIDLVSTPKGIKKKITKYWGLKARCPNCSHRYVPRSISIKGKNPKYGNGLKAWVAYQRLAMRLPFGKISQLIEDSFNLWIPSGGVNKLFRSFCQNYIKTEKLIVKKLLESPIIHVDETSVNIQGNKQYVWVFTDGDHVFFRLSPTRESNILKCLLKEYRGVLISDFYTGYDAVECCQQKCWVHLIRDINDDLRKSPFDSEFENFVLALRDLLIPIFITIEKYGLKKRNLNKFRKKVKKYYHTNIDGMNYQSDVTIKYQKRLSRYRDNLFLFLEHNGIPWNNNMAERALRHLAVQRKISGSFFTSGIQDYLMLLGITQTCRFQNKPLMEFLMSGEKNIDQFKGKKNIKGWKMK
jgi:predicted RecB family nuclease